jgi:hypothetical protein
MEKKYRKIIQNYAECEQWHELLHGNRLLSVYVA